MIPFQATDWEDVPAIVHKGETGTATWRTLQYDKVRVRLVEYSKNYKAGHWCNLGHVIFCVEGEFTSHMKDGSKYFLKEGMSYQTSEDKENPHLSTSKMGCKLFIVDGEFLSVK